MRHKLTQEYVQMIENALDRAGTSVEVKVEHGEIVILCVEKKRLRK